MSATTTEHVHEHDLDHEHHPTATTYWVTFLALLVLTAVEVAWSYLPAPFDKGALLVVPLLLMMVVKFLIVGGVFMHLQSDLKVLNGYWFTLTFGTAVVLAVLVYIAVFAAFQFQI